MRLFLSQRLTESISNRHFLGSGEGKWRGHPTQCALRPAADAARRAPHCDAARVKALITAQQPAWPQMTSTIGRRAHRYVRAALCHSVTNIANFASVALPRALHDQFPRLPMTQQNKTYRTRNQQDRKRVTSMLIRIICARRFPARVIEPANNPHLPWSFSSPCQTW